jgi:hypothetical protein
MSSMFLRDQHLATLYARTPGPVAFLDESYRAPTGDGERPFYAMSAVTFEPDQLDQVRDVLTDIAGSRWWHTTEAFKVGNTDAIVEMARYIADEVYWSVVTVEATVAARGGIDEARQTCLAAITRNVTQGDGDGAVRLLVADNVVDPRTNNADQRTVEALRAAGDVDRHVVLYHGRMGDEPLLWTGDLVAWAARRALALDDTRWIDPLRGALTVIDARTGQVLNMKQPQAAAATPGARQPVGEMSRGEAVVAPPSVPQLEQARQARGTTPPFVRGSVVLEDLVRQSVQHRTTLGPREVAATGNSPAAVSRRARAHKAQHGTAGDGDPDDPDADRSVAERLAHLRPPAPGEDGQNDPNTRLRGLSMEPQHHGDDLPPPTQPGPEITG